MATNTVNFFQPGTEAAVDANAIARQRQIAEMLAQQGRTPQQGQMVSGHFVAPGAASYVAQLVSALGGAYAGRQADERERALGQSLAANRAKEVGDFITAGRGTPGQPARDIQPLTPNDDEGNAMPVAHADAVPAQAPDTARQMAIAMQSQNPMLQQAGGQMLTQQMADARRQSIMQSLGIGGGQPAPGGAPGAAGAAGAAPAAGGGFGGIDPRIIGLMISGDPELAKLGGVMNDAAKPVALREGDLVRPDASGNFRSVYSQPKLPPGMVAQRDASGGVTGASVLPGFAAGNANIAGAETGAREGAKDAFAPPTAVDMPGGPRMLTPAQQRQMAGGGAPVAAGPAPGMANPTEAAMGRNAVINDNPSADAAREIAALRGDLNKVPDAASKQMIQAEIDRLTAQTQKYGGSPPAVATPQLPGIPLQNGADKVRETKTAEADVARDTARQTDIKTANKFLNIAARVKDVFNDGPTDSTVGSIADSAMAMVGKSTKGAESAQRLKALGGWLVSNVPRMEGPQSNFDVANYQVMAADVANDKLPLARRRAALESIEGMMQEVASGKAMMPPGGAPAAQGRPAAGPTASAGARSIKDFGYSTPDDAIKDAQRALQANPGARAEIMKRLNSMGVQLPPGAQGSW